ARRVSMQQHAELPCRGNTAKRHKSLTPDYPAPDYPATPDYPVTPDYPGLPVPNADAWPGLGRSPRFPFPRFVLSLVRGLAGCSRLPGRSRRPRLRGARLGDGRDETAAKFLVKYL